MTENGVDSPLTVIDRLDWAEFAELYWEKRPVLIKDVRPRPFAADEVFRAAARATTAAFSVADRRLDIALPPEPGDGDLAGYHSRVSATLDGRRYALVVSVFHAFDHGLWKRETDFYAGLWEQVGLPLTGAITTMFHGTYEHSPVGVHKDRFTTFMFALSGRKRMRFWTERPWTHDVTTVLDYREYLGTSFVGEVEPGDLLYWPSAYYHVGENLGGGPATSVNVGVPIHGHRAEYDLDCLLADPDPDLDLPARPDTIAAKLAPVSASMFTEGTRLPDALTQTVTAMGAVARGRGRRLAELELALRGSRGFAPVPHETAR
ncbi:hypothetical protein Afil01_12670 [Actinorhabdospora filicis]|uniref:JmjC domain-containing protein n=1 Tax=Actinorhabdospora filicis TaxID=1785913 RepID=A0A9W6W9A2_9ACTN|nr:cupin domain-containing protein [Actinorhabdospora filicis]GLZ76460.1 hypothetical protein Afil01_12670 [Actinorhabdospora filicis]